MKIFCRGGLKVGREYGIIRLVAEKDMKCWMIDYFEMYSRGGFSAAGGMNYKEKCL
jgi:hypothetical protein